ncbi:MAG: hypothetical protein QXS41_00615 [Candidatus Woesearchaeota archaeon]
MLTIKEIASYSQRKGNVFLAKSKYIESNQLKEDLAKELKIDENDIKLLTNFQGKFEKVQHIIINNKKEFPEKIKINQASLQRIKNHFPEEVIKFNVELKLPFKLSEEDLFAIKNAINYYVDEYREEYVSTKVLFEFDDDLKKLIEGIFRCSVRDFYRKGKSKDLLIKSIIKKDSSKLDVIKREDFKRSAISIINDDYTSAIEKLPEFLVRKYVNFYFKKIWNKEVSNSLKRIVPSEFLLEEILVLFLKNFIPFINRDTYVTLDLRSNNNLIDTDLATAREKHKPFLNFFEKYIENEKRKLFVNYIDLNVKEELFEYEIEPNQNFMVAKSLLMIKKQK